MNAPTLMSRPKKNAPARIARLFALQHAAFLAAPYPAASERLAKLVQRLTLESFLGKAKPSLKIMSER
jgi:hypothetical protein